MSAWIVGILKAVFIDLLKDAVQALVDYAKRKKEIKKTEEAAKEIENDKVPSDIRRDADNLP